MRLRIVGGTNQGDVFELREEEESILGRDESCPLSLEDPKVSRRHCLVSWRDGAWWLEDLGSSNGTWLNGERVRDGMLAPGDVLKVGDTIFEMVGGERETGAASPPARHAQGPVVSPVKRGPPWHPALSPARIALWILVPPCLLASAAGIYFFFFSPSSSSVSNFSSSSSGRPSPGGGGERRSRTGVSSTTSVPGRTTRKTGDNSIGDAAGDRAGRQGAATVSPGDLEREISGWISKREFRRALDILEERSGPGSGVEEQVQRVMQSAREVLETTRRRVDELASRDEYGEARNLIRDLITALPEEIQEEALADLGALADGERAWRQREAHGRGKLQEASSRTRRAIARLDFTACRELIESTGEAMGGKEAGNSPLGRLKEEVRLASSCWDLLHRFFRERAAGSSPLDLRSSPGRVVAVLDAESGWLRTVMDPLPGGKYVVRALSGARLRLDGGRGKSRVHDLFALADETLREIPGVSESPGVLEGLVLLLLYREGPDRARGFLDAAPLAPPSKVRLAAAIAERESLWIAARKDELSLRQKTLEGESQATAEVWSDLALGYAEVISLERSGKLAPGTGESSSDRFRQVRLESLRRSPPLELFRAARAEVREGRIHLVYDFRTKEQLEAFRPVGGKSSVRLAGKLLELKGECRLLEDRPFSGSLLVRLEIPKDGYLGSAPNINVALWTNDSLQVSPRGTLSLSRTLMIPTKVAASYVVFATGYRAVVADYAGTPLEEVRPVGRSDFVKLPAHVLFAGLGNKPLHSDVGECLWARALKPVDRSRGSRRNTSGRGARKASYLRGSLSIEIAMDDGSCRWQVNGRSLLPPAFPGRERLFLRSDRSGSVTLFTTGAGIRVASLEVEAVLNPLWLTPRLDARVEEELRSLGGLLSR